MKSIISKPPPLFFLETEQTQSKNIFMEMKT